MPQPLSSRTIALVKLSVPALSAHGTDITRRMYSILFQDAHIRELFNHSNQGQEGSQVKALASAILAYAQNIENLESLIPVVERIAHKHIGYHILPEHYPFVAKALLSAIADVLGDAATPELIAAWGEAYWFLADVLCEREVEIRARLETTVGGWNGWRTFRIESKVRESSVVTSFTLRPVDGDAVSRHKPGQYLTVRMAVDGGAVLKRNYSISCAPNNETYRISVKREANGQGASRFLHDQMKVGDVLEATPPAGDFYLADEPARPVVLLSGGVGLTPMVSILETIASDYPEIETHFVHGALNSETHAMDRHVRTLAANHGKATVKTFYSEPNVRDAAGYSHDLDGFITVPWLQDHVPFNEADFYLCGPRPFLAALVSGLVKAGVHPDRIHYEFFGPSDEILVAA
ncbi:NO-inducible flavohemoprotein [Rhizobium sp. CECT 9324]|uniref:NO-inducible flavohemoprotein n=1 Tax=Rhizobium sp. CECT 9324 TaxID=2845820 RepID=UPI001E44805A|nr:NO-inducible flavohemoprotein [Rhizobium sp. CECT 9324]CAH0340838.1 Flavohemoprotein [Rhizobium sp. CECT 9324]